MPLSVQGASVKSIKTKKLQLLINDNYELFVKFKTVATGAKFGTPIHKVCIEIRSTILICRLWDRYHVPQNVFLVIFYNLH